MAEQRDEVIKKYFTSLPTVEYVSETTQGSGIHKYKTVNSKGNTGYLFIYDKYINPSDDSIPDAQPKKRKEKKVKAKAKAKTKTSDDDDDDDDIMGMGMDMDMGSNISDDMGSMDVIESKEYEPERRLDYDPETGMIKDGQVHEMICDAFGTIVRQFKTHVHDLGPNDAATFDRIIRLWKQICDETDDEIHITTTLTQPASDERPTVPSSEDKRPTVPSSKDKRPTVPSSEDERRKAVDKYAMQLARETQDSEQEFGGEGYDDDDDFYDEEFEAIFKDDDTDYGSDF